MKIETNSMPKNVMALTIELSVEEMQPYLEKAAKMISEKKAIPGYRAGKAPLEVVLKQFGDMAVWQEAAYTAIEKTVFKAVEEKKFITVGQPKIDIDKLAPGNAFVYRAEVALMPKVEVGDINSVSVKKDEVKIDKEKIDATINNILKMRATETLVDREAKNGDKVEIDFEVKLNKVVIENGASKKYPLVLGENQMVPGFEENCVGLKANDTKDFEITFPKEYSNQQIAGKKCDVSVKMRAVYELKLPELNEEFIKSLGGPFKTEEELRKQVDDNLKHEEEHKVVQKAEVEMFEELIKISKFDDIPEILLENEIHKMLHELESDLAQRGIKLEDYLKHINKTEADLKLDFSADALKRVKVALINKEIGIENKIEVTDKDLNEEITKIKTMYKNNEEALKNLEDPRYQQFIRSSMVNDKVIKFLKEKIIK